MPVSGPDSLDNAVRKGVLPPVVFLFGDEEFLIDEALARIESAFVDATSRDFNFDVLRGSESSPNDIVERAQAYPLMSDRRVVFVREFDRMLAGRVKLDANAPLARYLKSPLASTLLVLVANTADFMKGRGGAKAPYDLVMDAGMAVQFKKVYDRDVPAWTSARVRTAGRQITPDALELFVGYAGTSLRVIANELEKLYTFVQDRPRITAEDVRSVIGVSRSYNVFELQKSVGQRNLEQSIDIAEHMLRAGEPAQLMISMLTRYFVIVWRLIELRTKTRDQNELARAVGVAPFFLPEYLATAGRYSIPHLQNAFEALLQVDVALKSSNLDDSIAIQMMLSSILRGERLLLTSPA